jgi:hypothetical protein
MTDPITMPISVPDPEPKAPTRSLRRPGNALIGLAVAGMIGGLVGYGASALYPITTTKASAPIVAGKSGAQGVVGPKGDPGTPGPQGPQGVPGPQGVAGPQGPAGSNGAAGAAGSNGSSGYGICVQSTNPNPYAGVRSGYNITGIETPNQFGKCESGYTFVSVVPGG